MPTIETKEQADLLFMSQVLREADNALAICNDNDRIFQMERERVRARIDAVLKRMMNYDLGR